MASIYNNIAANQTGPQAGPYLVTVRNMIPQFTNAPNVGIPGAPGYCFEQWGRGATCQTVYQGGFAAGQIDPNYVMLGPDMVNRPNIEQKVGLVQPAFLGVLSQADQTVAAANGTLISQGQPQNLQDTYTFGAKIAGLGRYQNTSDSFNVPAFGSNPAAGRFGLAAAGNTNSLNKLPPLNSITWNTIGGGQTQCGENPIAASVNQMDSDYIFGADYKNTPISDVVTLGQGLQPLSAAYNQLIASNQLGSNGSLGGAK